MAGVVLGSLMFLSLAHGQTLAAAAPERSAKVEELLRVTKTDAVVQEQLAALHTRIEQMATQQTSLAATTPEQKTLAADYIRQVLAIDEDEVGWTKLRPDMIKVYADSFTDAELDAIIAFYKTPAGVSMVNKTPEVAAKTMSLVETRIHAMQPRLEAATKDFAAKMQATAPAAPVGSAKTPTSAGKPERPPAANPPRMPIK